MKHRFLYIMALLLTLATGTWTLAATPAFDVELEVEYETALALSETTDNSAALTEWDGYEADVTLTRTLSIDFGDGETTGIIAIGTDRAASTDNATYTLDGRRISKATQKGVYIQNGKKVIIRSATQGDACQSKK